ncbi:hypothetical protein C8F04DRAFT_1268512 [Mycena alexandri]|uniref:Uncharacterized protein n=1 Tax=Mycena alexandri TaxID=1745969 RepID=A0AAD6WUU7_9AGAR|nr:hypothetical protein C8F04DRAFT_1268512 [Mycena alexandri]
MFSVKLTDAPSVRLDGNLPPQPLRLPDPVASHVPVAISHRRLTSMNKAHAAGTIRAYTCTPPPPPTHPSIVRVALCTYTICACGDVSATEKKNSGPRVDVIRSFFLHRIPFHNPSFVLISLLHLPTLSLIVAALLTLLTAAPAPPPALSRPDPSPRTETVRPESPHAGMVVAAACADSFPHGDVVAAACTASASHLRARHSRAVHCLPSPPSPLLPALPPTPYVHVLTPSPAQQRDERARHPRRPLTALGPAFDVVALTPTPSLIESG